VPFHNDASFEMRTKISKLLFKRFMGLKVISLGGLPPGETNLFSESLNPIPRHQTPEIITTTTTTTKNNNNNGITEED
jgi:hypothetical protein